MSIFHALTEKSWLTPGIDASHVAAGGDERGRFDAGVGLGVLLCVVTVLFTLITTAYLMRMGAGSLMDHGVGDWAPLREPPLLWFNTGALFVSSLAFRMALVVARQGDVARLRFGLMTGGLFGLAFLAGQIVVWWQLVASGYSLAAHFELCTAVADPLVLPTSPLLSGGPAVAFFYLITALHGLHIIGGLAAWGRTATHVMARADAAAAIRPVELCARYWDFLLLVWLLMFGLLLVT